MSALTITNLCKSFGAVDVLRDINLSVASGEFVALVGPSGCGKSTLLSMIAGLEQPSSGEIAIDSLVVNDVAPKDRDIAMVFQSYALYPTMTVRENMSFGMESRRVPAAEQKAAITRVAALLKIETLLDRKPGQLSGGQRQRVAMGRALVRNPKLFLFDEPLSNLDAKLRIEMRSEIKKLHHAVGKTTIYVTHDQVEAMTLANRIAVMSRGVLQQYDTPKAIYDGPVNRFVAGFMGSPSMNFLDGVITAGPNVRLNGAELPLPPRPGLEGMAGRPVVVGIRPEHFFPLHRAGADQRRTTVGTAEVKVLLVEPTGSETILLVQYAGQDVTVLCDPDDEPRLGDRLALGVDMRKVSLFNPDTGQRL